MVERKYDELERALFGLNGLLQQDEKILIFTESTDTLEYLEKRLLRRVPRVAKITGKLSIEERRKQVELFRDDCQIMLATDAGGESINLQFCRQMINYDIPWNPNKLEQRMGRIHRIGQKYEVLIYNLVAENTREGEVMIRLLDKMEQMKEDLGSDVVYDFMGEILDGQEYDLATLLHTAILNREHLDEVMNSVEKSLSKEHEELLQMLEKERMVEEIIDLPHLRREQQEKIVQRIPYRGYSNFAEYVLARNNVRIYSLSDGESKRIDRLPKFIRDLAKEHKLPLFQLSEAIRYTSDPLKIDKSVELLDGDHPLFQLSMLLTNHSLEKGTLGRYMISYPISESIKVDVYLATILDGTGKVIYNQLLIFGKRTDGSIIRLDPYWLFQHSFSGEVVELEENDDVDLRLAAVKELIDLRLQLRNKREKHLSRVMEYLQQSFQSQMHDLLDKRSKYERENTDNRNSALINQIDSQFIDLEIRRNKRLSYIDQQRQIEMKPPKRITQLEIIPRGMPERLFSIDYQHLIEEYERQHGRGNVKMYDSFALVDFYSERYNAEPRYIILTNDENYHPYGDYLTDLQEIAEKTYIYVVRDGKVVEEKKVSIYGGMFG